MSIGCDPDKIHNLEIIWNEKENNMDKDIML